MATAVLAKQKTPESPLRRRVRRVFKFLLLIGAGLVSLAVAWVAWRSYSSLPQLDGTFGVRGLESPVEVWRDAQGVPHLRAQSLEDLLFAQGYVTASDRLWQMDLSRRLAMGELAEILGERMLRPDIQNRTLGFRQVAERAVAELDPESRKLLAAYTRGVNEFIASHRHRLPVEFLLLRYRPHPWEAADSLSVALNTNKTLNTTWPDELMREHIRAKLNAELYADLFLDHSALDRPVAEPVSVPVAARSIPRQPEQDPSSSQFITQNSELPASVGSNNWVVSGAHTQSGKPLLANDPHLPHSIPSVWYMIHLKAPGLDVSGVSLPGLPLVIIGHNEHIAWGMTNTGPDVQDLYEENFSLREPQKYLHNGEWVEGTLREETIKVRYARDYRFTVKVTRHGPVVSHDRSRDLALRWTALEPHTLRYPFLKIDRAGNWQEFTAALRDFTVPMQNFVYADAEGNIGFYAAGLVPLRKQGDGTVPSPGSSDDYDWTGYIPFEALPHCYNPPGGILATANSRVVPDGYPYLIATKWAAPYRTARIYRLLESGNRFTVPDMLRIQTDIHSLEDEWFAKQLRAAARAHPPDLAEVRNVLNLLDNWDAEARSDSAATLVCEATRQALLERILKPKLGPDLSGYNWPMSTTFLENVLTQNLTRWLPPGDADFNVTLIQSLKEAVEKIPALAGSRDAADWQWGKTIPLTFRHLLAADLPLAGRLLNVGPVPQSGTVATVKQTTTTIGPSMRMVVDFSNFDASVQNITLGESGEFASPYYRDQFEAWYHGTSFPMLFTDQAVERGAAHKLTLVPASR